MTHIVDMEETFTTLRCPKIAGTCLLGFRTADDRMRWLPAGDERVGTWDRRLDGSFVHDVGAEGSILFTVRGGEGAGQKAGLYQAQLADRSFSSRLISETAFVNQLGIARYLDDNRVAVLEAGRPSHLSLYAPNGRKVAETIAVSRFFSTAGNDILTPVALEAANVSLPVGQLVAFEAGEQEDQWGSSIIGGPDVRIIGDLAFEESAQSTISAGRGGLVVLDGSGHQIMEICSEKGVARSRAISALPFEIAAAGLDGDGAITLVNETDLWGRLWQSLVRLPGATRTNMRTCDAEEAERELLSTPHEVLPDLIVTDHQASQAKGAIHYSVISLPNASGRVLIRPYGAFGMPVKKYALTPIEREWLKGGGRLIIPTLTGDGPRRDAEAGTGDYKAGAVAEIVAVVRDAARKAIGETGDYTLIGYSAGGFVAAKAALTHPSYFRSVVLISAALDLASLEDTPLNIGEFGPIEGGFETWFAGIPASASAPRFLIYQSQDDPRVPVEGGVAFARYVSRLGYRGQLTTGDRGGHRVGLREDTAPAVLTFIGDPS